MLQLLRVLAPLLAVFIIRTDRRLIRDLTGSSREQPVLLPHLNWLARWRLQRLSSVGAIVEAPAGSGSFFLDSEGWQRYRVRRRKRAAIVLAIVLLVVLALWIRNQG
jgi:hypothetical protein